MIATHAYAQFLADRDPFQVLTETGKTIPSIAMELGHEGLKRRYAPGKWSAAQVMAHLADSEMAFGFRIRQIISEPQLGIQTFDEQLWARYYERMNGLEAAQTFQALRTWNLSLFRALNTDDLAKAAIHPDRGPESAAIVIRVLAGHTLNHLAQLEKVVRHAET